MNRLLGLLIHSVKALVSNAESATTSPQAAGVAKRRDNNWVDGLRGVASLIVLTGHLNHGFAPYLDSPALEENGPSLIFQYPFLRLVLGGRGAVAIFFIITGYVNSLNPVKNFRGDNVVPSLLNMSKSSFTRTGRLFFPDAIAVLISWACSQLGLYKMGTRIDCVWYRDSSTYPDTFWESLVHLWDNLTIFWHTSESYYDPYHWTMAYILLASFRVYLVLLVLAFVRRRFWYAATAFLYWFAWRTEDYFIGMNVMVGIFLAQLHTDLGARATNLVPRPIPALLIVTGIFLWSYPLENAEWAWWSRIMQDLMRMLGPQDQYTINRHWVSVGPSVLMLGITFSRNAQRVLTIPLFNFLGRCSFAVYLLHHTMIRTVLIWMLYTPAYFNTPEVDDEGNPVELQAPSRMVFFLVMPLFYAILYTASYLWTVYVDTFCVKIVNRLKEIMFRPEQESQEKTTALPLTAPTSGRQ